MTETTAIFDSAPDTINHINRVRELLALISDDLRTRAQAHDTTKLKDPEKALFDEYTPRLRDVTYGSAQYKEFLSALKPALDHHYAHNSHHPEHYPNGVDGMTLMDLLEMFIDWQAASERHADGSIMRSIDLNRTRFKLSDQLVSILQNTARALGWADAPKEGW